jgi:predicted helicase
VPAHTDQFANFLPIGAKETKGETSTETIFRTYSLGVSTNRDAIVYDFNRIDLIARIKQFSEDYNAEVFRYGQAQAPSNVDDFVRYGKVKWSATLKKHLKRGCFIDYDEAAIRVSLYRPFNRRLLYYDDVLIDRPALFSSIFPTHTTELENRAIATSVIGYRAQTFNALMTAHIADLHLCASVDGHQCFPFYAYNEDGTNRRENITDWALDQFRTHYDDDAIGKWDIFYFVYGLLHHPGYREKYADNLKRELPRIPYAPDFWTFAEIGRQLAELHLNYETVEPWRLEWISSDDEPLSFRVEKMRFNKTKDQIKVNHTLTLAGIPAEAHEYRLGNRSALDWIIDQYQVETDKRSGITHDPNGYSDNPRYIVELIERVTRVSVETVRIVSALPEDFGG